jgi:DNA-binding MarR family transcriptional regulator
MNLDTQLFALFNEIGILAQLSGTLFERTMPKGMTLAQFSVLNHFVRLGKERSPAELADAFQVTRGTMTSTLQKLASKKLVEITPDPEDGRGKRVRITRAGEKMREMCIAGVAPTLASLASKTPGLDPATLIAPLRQLRIELDRERNDSNASG